MISISFLTLALTAAAYFYPKVFGAADSTKVSIANPWADVESDDLPPDDAILREVICGDFSQSTERLDAVDCIQPSITVRSPCFKHPSEADLVACLSRSSGGEPGYLSYRVREWREFSDDVYHPDLVTVDEAVNRGLPWALKVDGRWCYQGFERTSLGDAVNPERRNWSCGGRAGTIEIPGDNYFESPAELVFDDPANDPDPMVAFNLVDGSEYSTVQIDRTGSAIETFVVEEVLF